MSKSVFTKFLMIPIFAVVLSACQPVVDVRGYVAVESEIASIAPGVDTKDSVQARLGAPSTTGAEGSNTWYYISSRVNRVAFFAPREVDRQIVAIAFTASGSVSSVERYGLEDGRIIDLNRNTTVTDGRRLTFFEQLLGNIGNFSAEQFLGAN